MKNKLKDPHLVQWRTDADGYEYMMRTIFHMKGIDSLAQAERQKWFTPGWKERLERMRECHRAAGIPDERFKHPDLLK